MLSSRLASEFLLTSISISVEFLLFSASSIIVPLFTLVSDISVSSILMAIDLVWLPTSLTPAPSEFPMSSKPMADDSV